MRRTGATVWGASQRKPATEWCRGKLFDFQGAYLFRWRRGRGTGGDLTKRRAPLKWCLALKVKAKQDFTPDLAGAFVFLGPGFVFGLGGKGASPASPASFALNCWVGLGRILTDEHTWHGGRGAFPGFPVYTQVRYRCGILRVPFQRTPPTKKHLSVQFDRFQAGGAWTARACPRPPCCSE